MISAFVIMPFFNGTGASAAIKMFCKPEWFLGVRTDNMGGAQFTVRVCTLLFVFRTRNRETCTFMRFDKCLPGEIDPR
jgi:hypothetical protein